MIANKPAAVLAAGSNLILAQVPVDLPVAQSFLTVEYQGNRSSILTVAVRTLVPGLATANSSGTGLATLVDARQRPITMENPVRPGEEVTAYAVGLGSTDPVISTGSTATAPARTTNPVLVRVGTRQAETIYAGMSPSAVGTYQVTFKLPTPTEGGVLPLTLEVAGFTTQHGVTIPVSPLIRTMVNAASFSGDRGIAPGTIVELYGAYLPSKDTMGGFPSTSIDGVSVLINDSPVPLFRVLGNSGRLTFLMPTNARETGTASIRLRTPEGMSVATPLTLTEAAPGIFTFIDPADTAKPYAAATRAGTAFLAIPRAMASRLQLPSDCSAVNVASICGEPVLAGERLQIYATGLGRATPGGSQSAPPLPTGDIAPAGGNPLYETVLKPEVTIGGLPARVDFSGLTPGAAGLYQVNVVVPAAVAAGDDVPLVLRMPNGASHTSRIAIR
jgi:uncharacterized protein (TIGR03437 family)